MSRLLPKSFAVQLAVLLVLAVMAAEIPAAVLLPAKKTSFDQAVFVKRLGDRMVFLTRVLQAVPPHLESRVATAFDDPGYRFTLDPKSAITEASTTLDEKIYAAHLARRFAPDEGPVRTFFGSRDAGDPVAAGQPDVLRVSVRLPDGRWLNGETFFERRMLPWLRNFLTSFAAAVTAILAVAAFGLNRIVEPVAALAQAAELAGRGEPVKVLPVRGPRELRTMTASFNLMQERLHAASEDRARMLAAIGHDLRTPITSLRLRAEMVEEQELREAMVRTLSEMGQMAKGVLTLAHQDATEGDAVLVDVCEIARAIVEDHRVLGRNVTLTGPARLPFRARAQILRRSIDNLVDNAVRYGGCARVSLVDEEHCLKIRVDDDGPGVPQERVEEMFMPFARLECSRSTETGGSGLGLAIVRYSVRLHGGEVRLHNRPAGGLRAEIVLPKSLPQIERKVGRLAPAGSV